MSPEDLEVMQGLLVGRRVLTLGLGGEDELVLGLMPFALSPGGGALLVHGSRLAKHTRGLVPGAKASVLIHAEDTPGADPLQLPRLSMQVEVGVFTREAAGYDEARAAYLEKLPSAEITFGLGDFQLFGLELRRGRMIAGFGRAFDVSREQLIAASQGARGG